MLLTGDIEQAWQMAGQGALTGAIVGGAMGGYRGYKDASKIPGANPWTGRSNATNNVNRSTLPYTDKQMGSKFGEHIDPNREGYRTIDEYRNLGEDIYNNPASVKKVFPLNAPMYPGETHYKLNGNLLRLDPNGSFRSLYPTN